MMERIRHSSERSWAWFKERAHGKNALWWLILISFLEPIISPIVPETLMVAILLAGAKRWRFYALVTMLASVAGGVAGYLVGAYLFESIGAWVISSHALEGEFVRAQEFMNAHAFLAMFFVSFSPLPDKLFVITSGLLGVAFIPYILGYTLGRSLRFFLVAYIVRVYGERALVVAQRYAGWVTLGALFLIAAAVLLRFLM